MAVFGLYRSAGLAERAVESLLAAGCARARLSVMLPDPRWGHALVEDGTNTIPSFGRVVGGPFGVLPGSGALTLPGLEPLIAGGPFVALLTSLAVAGSVGGLRGALTGMGMDDAVALGYVNQLRDGGTVLAVHCDSAAAVDRAEHLLRCTGATSIACSDDPEGMVESERAAGADSGAYQHA